MVKRSPNLFKTHNCEETAYCEGEYKGKNNKYFSTAFLTFDLKSVKNLIKERKFGFGVKRD